MWRTFLPTDEEEWYRIGRVQKLGTMASTGIAFIGKDGIVLASDSKNTTVEPGGESSTRVQKIFQLGQRCGMICTGLHGVGENLVAALNKKVRNKNAPLETYIEHFQPLAKKAVAEQVPMVAPFNTWLQKWSRESNTPPEVKSAIVALQDMWASSFDNSFLIAGISKRGKPQLFQAQSAYHPWHPHEKAEKWGAIGVRNVAQYWMSRLGFGVDWDYTTCTSAILDQIVMFIIGETSSLAPAVGMPLQLAHINPKHGFRWAIDPPPTPPQRISQGTRSRMR